MKNNSEANRYKIFIRFMGLTSLIALLNPWTLSSVLNIPELFRDQKTLIFLIEISFVAVLFAYPIIKTARIRNGKTLLFGFITLFLMLLFVELGLRASNFVISAVHPSKKTENMSFFHEKKWTKDLFKETRQVKRYYDQYIGWEMEPFRGKYVNIDEHGRRKTWEHAERTVKKPKTIYIFGGSTMWGEGSRDDHTIASEISKDLDRKGIGCRVFNYGKTGYTFTQEIIYLILLLRERKEIPDLVVFYDGVNEVNCAFLNGQAGITHNLKQLREKINSNNTLTEIFLRIDEALKRDLYVYYAFSRILNPTNSYNKEQKYLTGRKMKARTIAPEIALYYKDSLSLLDKLSKAYGFKYACFWQPNAFTEEKLTSEEAAIKHITIGRSIGLSDLFKDVYSHMRTDPSRHFYVISDALNGRKRSVYWDSCHISEEGNGMVAKRISNILEKEGYLR